MSINDTVDFYDRAGLERFTNPSIPLVIKDPKIVIPAKAGISARTVGVCQKIPASAGMTVVCFLAARLIKCGLLVVAKTDAVKYRERAGEGCFAGL